MLANAKSHFTMTVDSIKTLAQKMNFVSFDMLHIEDQEIKSHWYSHEEGLDIYYFQKEDGSLIKLHVSFFGQVIEWNPLDGTRTGYMVEQEQGSEVFETVHFDSRTNSESLAQCLVLLENAICLTQELRSELTVLLQLSPQSLSRHLSQKKNFWSKFFSFFKRKK